MSFLTTDHQEPDLGGSPPPSMTEDEGEGLLLGSAPDGARSGMETTTRHDASPIMMEFLMTSPLAFVLGGDDAYLSP